MKKNDLQSSLKHLVEALQTLDDDREKQLEIYENLANFLFGQHGSVNVQEGRRGLLDPEVMAQLVGLMNNMTQSAKTKADIAKMLFEHQLILQDLEGLDGESDGNDEVFDRKTALSIVKGNIDAEED